MKTYCTLHPHRYVGILIAVIFISFSHLCCTQIQPDESFRFRIELTEDAVREIESLGLETPITGRLYVIVSLDGEREPRQQLRETGVPFWGMDVRSLTEGSAIVLDDRDASFRGYPLEFPSDLPAGDYYVQAFLNVYTTFHRSDGQTLEMHLNSGAGQNIWRAPGNAHSQVARLHLDPAESKVHTLKIDSVIPPFEPLEEGDVLQQGNPRDTEWVKFVKIKSDVLSDFWGHPMYIGANVLLPEGYEENPDATYPVIYLQGHFPGRRAPLGFSEESSGRRRSREVFEFWTSDEAPRLVAVTLRDANPYYDTSYSVNSANVGPYGDAITQELIPYLEEHFRIKNESWARTLAGGSTGGWEALAMQVWYPDMFGGCWGWCPDPVDFNYYQIVNIYEDDNAYYRINDWHQVERPNARRPDGNIVSTVRMENHYELAIGPNSRSGGQWAIWEALFSPVGENGYPRPIWDPVSGEINPETAAYWKDHYDINHYLQTNWETVGTSLQGKIHVAVGDMDTYYLEEGVYLLESFLQSVPDPPADASFEYGRKKPHCWIGESPDRPGEDLSYVEFIQVVADHMREMAPSGADTRSWRY